MIAMYTKNKDDVKQFHFFEVDKDSGKIQNLNYSYKQNEGFISSRYENPKPVALDDEDQLKLPDQLKQLTQDIRKELRFYS